MNYKIVMVGAMLVVIGFLGWLFFGQVTKGDIKVNQANNSASLSNFKTDTSQKIIELDQLLSGGPGKDGIPAISSPEFVSTEEAEVNDETIGILVEFEGQKRFYPFNILNWHEIVNDSIGNVNYAVTFCPLCGSGIVFGRDIEGNNLEFRVSGFLYESNLVMYDTKTESLWSQALGRAVVGEFTGTELEVLPMQRLTFADIKQNHADAQVLSRKTGYSRNYNLDPYGDYEDSDSLLFPVSVKDERFPAKTIMHVVPLEKGSLAISIEELPQDRSLTKEVDGRKLTVTREGLNVTVKDGAQKLPGYFEMWFSWATHHQDDGIVWRP